jgi:transposase
MFTLTSSHRYFLYDQATDMRKSFDGLSGIVQSQLQRDPMSGEVYVFINKRRNRIKLLHWEQGGFVLYYKRLEKGLFELPKTLDKTLGVSWSTLMMIVEGISLDYIRKKDRYQAINNIV